uniref:proteoglycan 4-like n=1 Tax=Jaculus jaculus TaxID=51337 RepID=UPI001E1B47AE|nr:proteoglycan 4-like [Jaculus jaculus]
MFVPRAVSKSLGLPRKDASLHWMSATKFLSQCEASADDYLVVGVPVNAGKYTYQAVKSEQGRPTGHTGFGRGKERQSCITSRDRGTSAEAKEAALAAQGTLSRADELAGAVAILKMPLSFAMGLHHAHLQPSLAFLWLCLSPSVQRKRHKRPKYLQAYEPVGQFHQAASEGSVETVRCLLRSGLFSVNDTDVQNRTALHYACAYGHREVVHLLLDYECTISVFDNEQCTPLIKASQREFHLCVDTLLTHGADPNDADMYGNTALHYAALNDDLELADLLLAYDANIEAKTKEGFTPYLLALQENKDFIAEFLEHMGADIHAEELLDRKHRKMHRRRMCKHTVRRREAARSTSPSFYRRATNRGARDSETERDEQDNDFNAQVERVRKKCLLKELTGSEKLHRRASATVSAAADPAAPGSGSAAPASSAAAADGTDPPVPATPAPPASPAPTSTPATTIPDVDPFDSPAPSACDTLDGSDAPDAPHIPDGTDTLHGPDSPDGPDSLDVPNPLHDPDTPTDLSAPADHAPLSSPIYLHLLFLLVLLVFFHLPLPFLMPLLFLLLLVMLCPYRPHAPLASSAPDTADGPDTYDGPDTPDGADTPDDPNTTDGPNITDGNDSPNGPDNSDRPANADGPDTPDGPYIPDGLDTSDGPVFPDGSKYPDVPDTANGPYTSDAPDSTNVSEYPDGLVTHHGPVTSNASDNPDLPVTPDGLDACDCPDTINDSDNTHGLVTPAGPDTPDDLHTPGGPDSPDSSDDPDGPNTCDVPVTHDGPDNHDDPDTLDGPDNTVVLDNPVGPDTPDVSDTSDGLDKPDGPDNPDGPDTRDGPDTPHSMDTCDDPDTSAVPDTSEAPTTSVGFEISNGSSTSENPRVSDGPDAQDGPDSPAPPAALLDPAITVDADVPAPRSVPADGPASPKAADYDDEEHALKAVKDVPTKEKNDKNESACPLEKGNKHEITKSPLKELVRIPTPKTSTAEMDTPKGVSGHLVSDSTIRMERNNQAFSYKCLMNGAPCPLAEEKKSENSKFTTSESVSASTSAGSPFEMGTVPEPQVDGSHVSGDLHRTGRRRVLSSIPLLSGAGRWTPGTLTSRSGDDGSLAVVDIDT